MTTKIVLDTNVCLDLFVFADPRWLALHHALRTSQVHAACRQDGRDEWLAVLHYPHLPVNDDNRAQIVSSFDQVIHLEQPIARAHVLPKCSDKDDQKFLEFARDSHAAYLITKDKALLKLARKIRALNLFIIETPEQFVARLVANPQGL